MNCTRSSLFLGAFCHAVRELSVVLAGILAADQFAKELVRVVASSNWQQPR